MSKEKKDKSEIKLIIIFLLALVACGIGGYFFGRMGARYEEDMKAILQIVANGVLTVLPMLFVAINAIVIGASFIIYIIARNESNSWDGESEEVIDAVEKKLNWSIIPINMLIIADVFFFGAMIYIVMYTELGDRNGDELFAFATVVFGVAYVLMLILNKLILDLVKKLNPEKRGSIFDINFAKEWEASSDEAERLTMYKAAYKAYHVVNITCGVMWGVAFAGMLLFQAGLLPLFCVTAIWITLIATYSIVCAQIEGKR